MIVGNVARRAALAFVLAGSAAATLPATTVSVQAASEIKAVVNGMPITSYQIRQRAAFLKLRRVGGNATQKATDELIDEALKKQEIGRRGIAIPDEAVDEAFGRFAAENKLTSSDRFCRAPVSRRTASRTTSACRWDGARPFRPTCAAPSD